MYLTETEMRREKNKNKEMTKILKRRSRKDYAKNTL